MARPADKQSPLVPYPNLTRAARHGVTTSARPRANASASSAIARRRRAKQVRNRAEPMAAALSAFPRAASRFAPCGRRPNFRALCAAAAAAEAPKRRLVLYTKPGCCLCDGLKEKLHAASLLAGTPYSLASLELQASQFARPCVG